MAAPGTAPLLPPEDLASQLSTIEVLLSIYNGSTDMVVDGAKQNEDVVLTAEAYRAIRGLAEFLSLPLEALGKPPSVALRDGLPSVIQMGINIDPLRGTLVDAGVEGRAGDETPSLVLDVGFTVRRLHAVKDGSDSSEEHLRPRWNLKQADWLDRAAYERLCQVARAVEWEPEGENVGYVMNVIEAISEACLDDIDAAMQSKAATNVTATPPLSPAALPSSPLVFRTWHLLPSLSMKDKRKELVSYAARYQFTGFVLAGKPGLVVLECANATGADAAKQIDLYWSDIKTNSWSDLPPAHKKVSEKYREDGVHRCFTGVQDVTGIDELGGIAVEEGGRVPRNDLDKVKTWLRQHGCSTQLDIVLGKES